MAAKTTQRRAKPTSTPTAAGAVLALLRGAYPEPIHASKLEETVGRCFPSRVAELTEAGWQVDTIWSEGDARPSYRLASLARGQADPVLWGLRARLGASTGLVITEYGTSGAKLPEAVWERLSERVAEAIAEELAEAGIDLGTPTPKRKDAHVVDTDDLAPNQMDEFFAQIESIQSQMKAK